MLDYKFTFPPVSTIKRYPLSNIDVLVVGGGIGGMFAAINCYQKGHNVRVLEAASGFDINGGFIRIVGSVIDHLERFPGLREGLEQLNLDAVYQMFDCKGEMVLPPKKLPIGAGNPYGGMNVHRAALQRLLYEYAVHLGIEVQLNVKATRYFEDEKARKGGVKTSNDEEHVGDIIIAADGINSCSANLIHNKGLEGQAKSSGYAIFRANYPAELAYKKPKLFERFAARKLPGKGNMQVWSAANGYAIIQTNDEIVNFHIARPDPGGATERWDQKARGDALRAYLDQDEWDSDIRDLAEACPEEALFDWKLVFRNPKPNWVSPHGRVLQLGDAAHTFLPSSGNGATQAMEDGISLSSCLQLAGRDQIPLAARVHNKLRFERTSCAQKMGFKNRERFVGSDIEALKAKQMLLGPVVGSWITLHDSEQYVYENYGKCVNHLLTDAPFANTNIPPGHEYKPWCMDDFLSGNADESNETGNWR